MNRFNMQNYFPYVPISNEFIEFYMLKSNPNFVIIYIYILKKSMENKIINLDEISSNLDLLNSDVIKALQYWEQNNLIKFMIINNIVEIEYFVFGANQNSNTINANNKTNKNTVVNVNNSLEYNHNNNNKELDVIKTTIIEPYNSQPITPELQEPNNINNNQNKFFKQIDDLKQIFKIAENKFGKTLSSTDERILADLYNDHKLTTEILALIFTYCSEINKNNVNYAKIVALNWIENNITTTEKAETYLNGISQHKIILSFLGIEKKQNIHDEAMINKWLIDYNMPVAIIEKACEISLKIQPEGSLKYTDGILKNWFNKEIKTLEQIEADQKEHQKFNGSKNNNFYNKPKSPFFNYNSAEITDELIEKIEKQNFK